MPNNLNREASKVPETFSKKDSKKMIADAAAVLREEAKFRWPSLDYHQERIWRLREWLKWTHRRVRSIYNREEGVVLDGAETLRLLEIEAEQRARKQQREASGAVRKSQAEYRDLEARIAALEALFAAVDEEHGGPHLDALVSLARGQGRSAQDSLGGPETRGGRDGRPSVGGAE